MLPPRQPAVVSIRSAPARPNYSPRTQCPICGRRRLARKEFNWRRGNGLAVWRCNHRRPSTSTRHDLLDAGGVIAALATCAFLLSRVHV
jgi:hypothetical protein